MRPRTLLLLGMVVLLAPACGGRLLRGSVSLSPGETVWTAGQTPAAEAQPGQVKPAKPSDRPRSAQNRARTDRRAAGAQTRKPAPAAAGTTDPAAVEATGTAGEASATPASALETPAPATPEAQSAVPIEAGFVRQFQSTPVTAVTLAIVAIVMGAVTVQRYRRPRAKRGAVEPFGRR
jgi:hypothetical protein